MSGKRSADDQAGQVQDVKEKKPRNDPSSLISIEQLDLIQKSQVEKANEQALKNFIRDLGSAIVAFPNSGPATSWTELAAGDPSIAPIAELLDITMASPQWNPPPATSHPFTTFASYMLPPCVELTFKKRDDLDRLREFAAATYRTDQAALSQAKSALEKAMKQHMEDITPILQTWIDDAFKSLPAKTGTGSGYEDDILHIVLIPEFAFNGYIEQFEFVYSAGYPQPEVVENKLTDMIHKKLQTDYAHLRVICAFSIASYLDMHFTFDDSGVDKMASANRMTVVTSTDKPYMRVTKFAQSSTDGWKDDLNSGLIFKDVNTVVRPADDPNGLARLTEIKLDLNCFGELGKSIAFGTCLDAICDRAHGDVNLVVMLGCGCPTGNMVDQKHPFILNDTFGWSWGEWDSATNLNSYHLDKRSFFGVGLYEHYAVRPPTLPVVVNDVKSMGANCGYDTGKWTTSAQCYYRSDLVQTKSFGNNGVRGTIAYVAPLPFPSKTAAAVF